MIYQSAMLKRNRFVAKQQQQLRLMPYNNKNPTLMIDKGLILFNIAYMFPCSDNQP